jgi:hypothetical protein
MSTITQLGRVFWCRMMWCVHVTKHFILPVTTYSHCYNHGATHN